MKKLLKILWTIFLLPGIVVLWFEYMYPSKGQSIASGRRRKSKVVTIITAILGWFIILVLIPFDVFKYYPN